MPAFSGHLRLGCYLIKVLHCLPKHCQKSSFCDKAFNMLLGSLLSLRFAVYSMHDRPEKQSQDYAAQSTLHWTTLQIIEGFKF